MLQRWFACLVAVVVMLAAPPSLAQSPTTGGLPAVSEINGKFSLGGGATGAPGRSSAIGIAEGSLTAPLGHSFGVQVDGLAATAYNSFFGGGTAHLFWRDPQVGLFGPIAALAGGNGATVGWYGAEGEIFASAFTVSGYGGYQDAGSTALLASGGFYYGRLTVYPVPDLALAVGGGQFAGQATGSGSIEYQPDFFARHGVAFFAEGSAGDNSLYSVTGGIRIYLGPAKTLIRRHREDDPHTSPFLGSSGGLLVGNGGSGGSGGFFAGNGGRGGNGGG